MQQHDSRFADRNIRVAVVTFETPARARAYLEEMRLPWPVLIDDTRETYRAYDMLRGSIGKVYGLGTWWAYFKEFARGRWPRAARADTLQLGGDVLIDPSQRVRLHHVGRGPADRPDVAALLRASELELPAR